MNTDTRVVVVSPLFARRLRERISQSGLSLRELETKSGVNKDTIGRWKKSDQRTAGSEPPGVQMPKLRKVAEALGVNADFLLGTPEQVAKPDGTDRDDLLLRFSSLQTDLDDLRGPTAEAAAALTESLMRVSEIETLLPRLRELAEEARRIAPGG